MEQLPEPHPTTTRRFTWFRRLGYGSLAVSLSGLGVAAFGAQENNTLVMIGGCIALGALVVTGCYFGERNGRSIGAWNHEHREIQLELPYPPSENNS